MSNSIEPLRPSDSASNERGADMICPSPPKPSRPLNHVLVSRRSSTGNVVKQKLAAIKSDDTRRVHSGPVKRTSPKDLDVEERAKSSPTTGRHDDVPPHSEEKTSYVISQKMAQQTSPDSAPAEATRLSNIFKEKVRPILKEMDRILSKGDSKRLCDNCLLLSTMLQTEGILPETKEVGMSNFKGQILKSLFSYLGLKDSRLHLRLAKIVLMV